MKSLLTIFLVIATVGYAVSDCSGQNVETKTNRSAISIAAAEFATGKYQAIVERLKKSEDVEDLFYLGLAYEKLGNASEAADALKKSFLKAYENAASEIKDSLKTKKGGDLRERLVELERNNSIGYAAAQKAYDLRPSMFNLNEFRLKATVLKDAATLPETETEIEVPSSKVAAAKINYRPPLVSPGVTRRNEMPMRPFTVRLIAVFGADSAIKLVFPLDDVIDAYTFSAISNAKGMRFEPAKLNNVPVGFLRQMEYSFSWY